MLLTSFYIAFILYLILLFLCIFGLRRGELTIGLVAFLVNGVTLALAYFNSGQLPVFNLFESFLIASFILAGLALFSLWFGDHFPRTRLWVWMEVLVLFIILLLVPKQLSNSAYDHDYLFIILFHLFRVIALALMLYSSACFIELRVQRRIERGENARTLSQRCRNFLVLSAVFFLSGEYVGIVWSQNGWGDFWHWNSGFFQSTLIVLYLMIALHIPGKGGKAEGVRSLIGGLSGFFMMTMMILRSFY